MLGAGTTKKEVSQAFQGVGPQEKPSEHILTPIFPESTGVFPYKLFMTFKASFMHEGGGRFFVWFFFSLGMSTFILNINKGEVKNTRSIEDSLLRESTCRMELLYTDLEGVMEFPLVPLKK